jgi:hypothetical protein
MKLTMKETITPARSIACPVIQPRPAAEIPPPAGQNPKWVYLFDEGHAAAKNLLGGKVSVRKL